MVFEIKIIEASGLRRELKARYLTMIVIGGFIGIGFFVVFGVTIFQVGSGGVLFSYMLIGLMVYFLMISFGELVVYMSVFGSFVIYGQNYVEEGFGFALGWNYWYNWAVIIVVDLVVVQLVMSWWFSDISGWIWSALFFGVIFLLNYILVRGFGEAEYWFLLIKVTIVIVFIIVGVLMIIGIFKGAQFAGWSNWIIGEASFVGGFAAMIGVVMIVGFFFQGIELIGIVVGEFEDSAKNILRAVRQVFWRILLFYVFAILIISLIISYIDSSLLRNDVKDISVSSFILVFQYAGLFFAAAVMNVVILTAVLLAGNFGMYAFIRMLYILACDGKASRIFVKLSRGGVSRNALYATTVIVGLCFLIFMFGNQTVYLWLLNIFGMTGFIVWLGIVISYYRFRRGYVLQGYDINDLSYRLGFFLLGSIFVFILCLIIILGQNYEAFLKDIIDWGGVAVTYIGISLFLIIWFGDKLIKGIYFVRYSEMKFSQNDKK